MTKSTKAKHRPMKAQFIVTIEGSWLQNGKPVTRYLIEKDVREALKEEFDFLATKVSVKAYKGEKDVNDKLFVSNILRPHSNATKEKFLEPSGPEK